MWTKNYVTIILQVSKIMTIPNLQTEMWEVSFFAGWAEVFKLPSPIQIKVAELQYQSKPHVKTSSCGCSSADKWQSDSHQSNIEGLVLRVRPHDPDALWPRPRTPCGRKWLHEFASDFTVSLTQNNVAIGARIWYVASAATHPNYNLIAWPHPWDRPSIF